MIIRPHYRCWPFVHFELLLKSLSLSSANLTRTCVSHSTAEPLPLMDLCRRAARLALGRDRLQEIESLPLPQSLKNYLQYQWLIPAEPTGSTQTKAGYQKVEMKNVHSEQRSAAKVGHIKGWRGEKKVDEVRPFRAAPASFGIWAAFHSSFFDLK